MHWQAVTLDSLGNSQRLREDMASMTPASRLAMAAPATTLERDLLGGASETETDSEVPNFHVRQSENILIGSD